MLSFGVEKNYINLHQCYMNRCGHGMIAESRSRVKIESKFTQFFDKTMEICFDLGSGLIQSWVWQHWYQFILDY